MSVKADNTREKILHTAKQHFLQYGLDGASLRSIVKDAGLTTGAFYKYFPTKESLFDALIDPHTEYIYQIFDNVLADFEELSAGAQTDHMVVSSEDGTDRIVDYVYDHYDNFRLLLKCGDSGKYADFIHGMAERDIKSTEHYIEIMRSAGFDIPVIDRDFMHMVYTGFFSSIFQIIEHDIDKETAKKNISLLKKFQTGGWERLLGIRFPETPE